MRISYNWLRRYIDLTESPDAVAEKLTSLGLEVEAMEDRGKKFDRFVVGEVLSVEKHPNADRLRVCTVSTGQSGGPLSIVCGAPNVAAGQKVIVGLVGAVVPHNQHDPSGNPFVLSKATIRGVESSGMICSAKEMGLGEDGSGIMVLNPSATVGISLSEFLGENDAVFEIGITPNRPDCLGHIGVARDLAAAYDKQLQIPSGNGKKGTTPATADRISVRLENAEDCPRYTARIIDNVKVQESPEWLKQAITAAGLRPINAVVDVTNFVMLEYGQPLHAFDYDRIADKKIIVKSAAAGESFVTLDGKKHQLAGTELMICDGKRSIAIGGVMGGENSEISPATVTVVLEAAYFSPTSIRKTSKRLGISTDASYRFERGVDPNMTAAASLRAAELIAELTGGTIADGIVDVYPHPIAERKISVRTSRVNDILGTSLSSQQIIRLLAAVGMKIDGDRTGDAFVCSVPTFRPDIEQEIDLIEEVARLYGYDNIENKSSGNVVFTPPSATEQKITALRYWCESNGWNEILSNSLIDVPTGELFTSAPLKVKNPLSVELEVLRPSLLSTMLSAVAYNYNHGAERVQIFEIGTTFANSGDPSSRTVVPGVDEKQVLGLLFSGNSVQQNWCEKERAVDIFDLKGAVQQLLACIGLDNSDLIYYNAPTSLTELTIGIEINNTYVGFIGRCVPKVLKKFKIEKEVFYAEIDLGVVTGLERVKRYTPVSKFPTVVRDLAFVVPSTVRAGDMVKKIQSVDPVLITGVRVFDLFEGASIGEGKKSIAFSVSINSAEKTLKDSEIDTLIMNVSHTVNKTFDAALRSI